VTDPDQLYLIDSSAWIPALRRRPDPQLRPRIDALIATNEAATTGMVRIELLRGARDQEQFVELRFMLSTLRQLPTTEAACTEAGRIGQQLRSVGRPVPTPDILIATIALIHDAVLVHRDADYETIAQHTPLRTESHL
jgi:predicted nucleic acid-binding protein